MSASLQELLALPGWENSYRAATEAAIEVLKDRRNRSTISLMAALWPLKHGDTTSAAREKLQKILYHLATHELSAFATRVEGNTRVRGPGGNWRTQFRSKWVWHWPAEVSAPAIETMTQHLARPKCRHCGKEI